MGSCASVHAFRAVNPGRCPSPTRPASSSQRGRDRGPPWTGRGTPLSSPPPASGGAIEVPGATPVAGTIGKTGAGGGPLAISGLSADPETISPNDDGAAESSTITYTTTAAATVTATLLDAVAGQVAELLPATSQAAGEHTLAFDGLGQPDGVYTVVITAVDTNGTSVTQQVQITVTRTLGSASLAPAVFTPNGDGKGDELEVSFQLAVPATVKLRVLRDGTWVATPFAGPLPAGAQSLGWDGAKRVGAARDGSYVAVVEVTDTIGTSSLALPFLKDGHPPAIKLFARPARLWVSEAATVTVRVNGALRHLQVRGPGYLALTGDLTRPHDRRRRARCCG